METSFDSPDSQQVLLPLLLAFQELLPASGRVFIAGLLSPPYLIADTTEAFYRKNFLFKKRQPGGLGFGWLVGCDGLDPGVRQRSLEIQSGSKKNRDIKTQTNKKKISQQEIG